MGVMILPRANMRLVADVYRGWFRRGNRLIVHNRHNGRNQKFCMHGNYRHFKLSTLVGAWEWGRWGINVALRYRGRGLWMRYYGSRIRSQQGRCLDIYGGRVRSGTRLIWWRCHGKRNQQFYMQHVRRLVAKKQLA